MPGRTSLRWSHSAAIARRNPNDLAAPPEVPPVGTRFSTGEDLWMLDGPTSAPPGAVTVDPATDDLGDVTSANSAGTTFYLLAGRHLLGGGSPTEFDQVQPKAGNVYIGAPGAILDGRNINLYAFTTTVANVTIRYIEITNFACFIDQNVVNHDEGDNWTIEYCNIHSNYGSAIGIGSGMVLRYNWLHHNQQYAWNCSKPAANGGLDPAIQTVLIDYCEISHNGDPRDEYNADGTSTGVGRNGAGKFWDADSVTFSNSWVHHSYQVGIWADTDNQHMNIEGNLIEDNWGEAFFYEISYNFRVYRNLFRRNALGKGLAFNYRPDNFPVACIYISESGSESRIGGTYAGTSEIANNKFINNWAAVTLWENADRFCNSPSNTSGKSWRPRGGAATLAMCNNPTGRNLTVTLTSGSPDFVVTSGSLATTDEGQFVSGTGIPGGTKILQDSYVDSTHASMDHNATSSGSVTMAVAAGSIDVNPGYYDCRWHTQYVDIHNNIIHHNESEILGANNTLQSGVVIGKMAILSQVGTFPSWSPYQGTVIQDAITFSQSNVWRNNTYRGAFSGMPHDTGTAKTFAEWQASPYFQDSGSTRDATDPVGGGGGAIYKPNAPTSVTGTAGNAQVRVDFDPPVDFGGDFIIGYEVTSSPGGITANGVTGPIIVTGLTNNTAYTFTVKTRNTLGQSSASSASGSVTPTSGSSFGANTRPWQPTHVTARKKTSSSAQVSFLAPSSDGGSAITSYTVTSSPGGLTGNGSLSPITVSGLTPGTPYTFTVTATNAVGTGPSSPPSTTPITP